MKPALSETANDRPAARRRHQAELRYSPLFSVIALGWAKPYMGVSAAWVTVARKVLGR